MYEYARNNSHTDIIITNGGRLGAMPILAQLNSLCTILLGLDLIRCESLASAVWRLASLASGICLVRPGPIVRGEEA